MLFFDITSQMKKTALLFILFFSTNTLADQWTCTGTVNIVIPFRAFQERKGEVKTQSDDKNGWGRIYAIAALDDEFDVKMGFEKGAGVCNIVKTIEQRYPAVYANRFGLIKHWSYKDNRLNRETSSHLSISAEAFHEKYVETVRSESNFPLTPDSEYVACYYQCTSN